MLGERFFDVLIKHRNTFAEPQIPDGLTISVSFLLREARQKRAKLRLKGYRI